MSDDSNTDRPAASHSPETIWLMFEMNGGVVSTTELAVKIGEALCEAHYGAEELRRQRPLHVTDKGTYWRVEGSWNRNGEIDDLGAFFLSIQKRDGLVIDLGQWGPRLRLLSPQSIIDTCLPESRKTDTE